jgi:8-oxo-dGTP pyrophosphatase MutT (NUDIX family)
MSPVARVGGRVLLVDPNGCVLLIHERIEGGRTHWLTPGGGVEAGELPAEAAAREALEETGIGIDLPRAAEALLVTQRLWSWAGIDYDQVDHFFAVPVAARPEVSPRSLTAMEHQTLIGHRWWSVDELRATTETIVPAHLADVVEGIDARRRSGA